MPTFELLLILGVVGFYLYDSAILLCADELMFTESGRRWTFLRACSRWQLLRRNLYLPNPLRPDIAEFCVCWAQCQERTSVGISGDTGMLLVSLRPLRQMVIVLLFLQLVALPSAALLFGATGTLVLVFGVIYLIILAMLAVSYLSRDALALAGSRFWLLAFESLACPPFALNLVRKITRQHALTSDPVGFAKHTFQPVTLVAFANAIRALIDEQATLEDDESAQKGNLKHCRERLKSLMP